MMVYHRDGGADVIIFVSTCVTHSLVEGLTMLLGNKDKNSENPET